MSNVLIGIIGVILFIGLALSGALFFGPRFQESRNSSVAAASVQSVAQAASAINLANFSGEILFKAGVPLSSLETSGYLKDVPRNPTGGAELVALGSMGDISDAQATFVSASIPEGSDGVCSAIVRQTKNATDTIGIDTIPVAATVGQIPAGPSGCFRATADMGGFHAGNTYAFARI